MRSRRLGPSVVAALFVVAVAILLAAGRDELAAPPVRGFAAWAEERGPVTAAVAILRLLALAAASWLAMVAVIAAVAKALGAPALATAAERSLPPVLRRVLTGLAGAGTAGVVVLTVNGTAASGAADAPPALERMVRLPGQPADPPPTETMTVLAVSPPAAPDSARSPGSWTVAPGDSFWSITEELLAESLGRRPSDAEIDPAWRRLIDANRDRLVSGDPDLLLPGQQLEVPPP